MREKMTLAVILEETGGEVLLCNCQNKRKKVYGISVWVQFVLLS